MKMDMLRPCDTCPFRNDRPPFLRPERTREIAAALLDADESFPCHKTIDYDDEGLPAHTPAQQHCAGAMIWLTHQQMPNQWMRIAARLGCFDPAKLDLTAPVCRTRAEFVGRHERSGASQ